MASIRLHENELLGQALGERPLNAVVVAIDLVNSFYLFWWESLASLFAVEHSCTSEQLGASTAVDEHGKVCQLEPHDRVFPCLTTLCMGASWSLYFCHSVVARLMVIASQCFELSGVDAVGQLVVDGRPCPRLGPGGPILVPYVDSCNAICCDAADADHYWESLRSVLDSCDLAL